jgi:two-component system, sensor histidine kinase
MSARDPVRILLVDDHVPSTDSIGQLLRLLGYNVRTAHDGVDALARATEFGPQAALIGLTLPLIDGFDVARYMRQLPETRESLLIAMTGWASDIHTRRARDAGFDLHLVKPLSLRALTHALMAVGDAPTPPLRRRSY